MRWMVGSRHVGRAVRSTSDRMRPTRNPMASSGRARHQAGQRRVPAAPHRRKAAGAEVTGGRGRTVQIVAATREGVVSEGIVAPGAKAARRATAAIDGAVSCFKQRGVTGGAGTLGAQCDSKRAAWADRRPARCAHLTPTGPRGGVRPYERRSRSAPQDPRHLRQGKTSPRDLFPPQPAPNVP